MNLISITTSESKLLFEFDSVIGHLHLGRCIVKLLPDEPQPCDSDMQIMNDFLNAANLNSIDALQPFTQSMIEMGIRLGVIQDMEYIEVLDGYSNRLQVIENQISKLEKWESGEYSSISPFSVYLRTQEYSYRFDMGKNGILPESVSAYLIEKKKRGKFSDKVDYYKLLGYLNEYQILGCPYSIGCSLSPSIVSLEEFLFEFFPSNYL